MPEYRHIHIGPPPRDIPSQNVLVLDPGLGDLSGILRDLLQPLNTGVDAKVFQVRGSEPHTTTEEPTPDHFDAVLALADGLVEQIEEICPLTRALTGRIVTPETACLRAVQSLGLQLDKIGFISEHWSRSQPFGSASWAAVNPDDPGRFGGAVSRMPDAEVLVLYSLAFSDADRAMISQISRRPTILLRNAMTAELGTLLSSPVLHTTAPALAEQPVARETHRVQLTPREKQVLRELARGLSSKEIAAELTISPRTVDIYRSNLLTKMRARNTRQLLYMLQSENLGIE